MGPGNNFNPDKSREFRERMHTAQAMRNKFNSMGLLRILASFRVDAILEDWHPPIPRGDHESTTETNKNVNVRC